MMKKATKMKVHRPQATENTAKDVVKPKTKLIPVPDAARAEITRLANNLDTYIAGIAAGMGIKGPWGFDMKTKMIVVPDTEG